MRSRLAFLTLALAAGASVMSGAVSAEDTKMTMKQLPAAVQKAAEANLRGGVIKGVAKEVEKGQTFYEVETTVAGHARDLLFDKNGALVAVEEEIVLDAAPAAVRTALTAHGKVLEVESVTKGSTVSYEGVVEKGGRKSEVAVDAEGKPIKG